MTTETTIAFTPIGDRVVVRADETLETTPGGIVLTEGSQEKPQQGVVVAAGPGRLTPSGTRLPMQTQVGDTVLYSQYAENVTIDGEDFVLVREDDLYGVLGPGR